MIIGREVTFTAHPKDIFESPALKAQLKMAAQWNKIHIPYIPASAYDLMTNYAQNMQQVTAPMSIFDSIGFSMNAFQIANPILNIMNQLPSSVYQSAVSAINTLRITPYSAIQQSFEMLSTMNQSNLYKIPIETFTNHFPHTNFYSMFETVDSLLPFKNSIFDNYFMSHSEILKIQNSLSNFKFTDFDKYINHHPVFNCLYQNKKSKHNSTEKVRHRAIQKVKAQYIAISLGDILGLWEIINSYANSSEDEVIKLQLLSLKISIFLICRFTILKINK